MITADSLSKQRGEFGEPIVIWGAGAIGGTIGAHLVRAGRNVVFVDVAEPQVRRIAEGRLSIEGPIANFTVAAPAFTPAALTGTYDLFLLAVKSQFTAESARAITKLISPRGAVVSLQNGLNELIIADIVGPERTIGAAINLPADVIEPGRIAYGEQSSLSIGELDGRHTARIAELAHILKDFTPHVRISDDIISDIWGKMALASLLTASALTNEPARDFIADLRLRPMIVGLVREVAMIAEMEKHPARGFKWFRPEQFLSGDTAGIQEQLMAFVASGENTTKLHSGIWRDLAVHKRKTEVTAQFAIMQDAARRHQLEIPLNDKLASLIADIESGRREIGAATADELLALTLSLSPERRTSGKEG